MIINKYITNEPFLKINLVFLVITKSVEKKI